MLPAVATKDYTAKMNNPDISTVSDLSPVQKLLSLMWHTCKLTYHTYQGQCQRACYAGDWFPSAMQVSGMAYGSFVTSSQIALRLC